MRAFLSVLTLAVLILLGTTGLTGCGGPRDEVLDYNPEESERQRAEYEETNREAMERMRRQARPGPPSRGN